MYEWHMSDGHAAQAALGVKGGGVPACLPLAKGNGSIPYSETRILCII